MCRVASAQSKSIFQCGSSVLPSLPYFQGRVWLRPSYFSAPLKGTFRRPLSLSSLFSKSIAAEKTQKPRRSRRFKAASFQIRFASNQSWRLPAFSTEKTAFSSTLLSSNLEMVPLYLSLLFCGNDFQLVVCKVSDFGRFGDLGGVKYRLGIWGFDGI